MGEVLGARVGFGDSSCSAIRARGVAAKVGALNARVVAKCLCVTRESDLACYEDVGARCGLECEAGVLFDEEDAEAVGRDDADGGEDFADELGTS